MNKSKRLILGITGIRAEYDIMSSVFKAISNHPDLKLEVVVTGAHLTNEYGYTLNQIKEDGFKIADIVPSLLSGDDPSYRVKGLAIQLQSIIQTVVRVKPDILVVLGDREESITTALLGSYMNVPVAHICGGDKSKTVDDQIRHAVTKLSHIHLVTNENSMKRILKLGEESFRVFNVGNPGLDRFINTPNLNKKEIFKSLNLNININDPLLIVIQHSVSSEINAAYYQMKETLESIKFLELPTLVINPNSDAGSEQIIRAIKEYQNFPNIYFYKNIPRREFINLLKNCSCLIGNSSSGILEAPSINLPVVNIGNRQNGRLHSNNVQFVNHNKNEITNAIKKAIYDEEYKKQVLNCINPYGDGNSSEKISKIFAEIKIDHNLLIKDITF